MPERGRFFSIGTFSFVCKVGSFRSFARRVVIFILKNLVIREHHWVMVSRVRVGLPGWPIGANLQKFGLF